MAVLDAWAYGLPVVATPVGGLPDIAVDNKNVMLFPVGDIQALSTKLLTLIEDVDVRGKISCEGLKLADTVFNQSNIANQLGQLYSSLV